MSKSSTPKRPAREARSPRRSKATIPAWLIMRPDWTTYRAAPLWTFSVLSLHSDGNNQVTMPMWELAASMQTEQRTLWRHLDYLKSIGAITAQRDGVTDASTYTLHIDAPAHGARGDELGDDGGE